jgi:uncharacterized protein (DUF433 family)
MEAPTLPTPLAPDDRRLIIPLFTTREAARYVGVPGSTMRNWVRGYDYPIQGGTVRAAPLVSSLSKSDPSNAVIPFIGLAEALVIQAFRRKNLAIQKVRAALHAIEQEVALEHALANKTVYTSGATILWDYARKAGDEEIAQLVEPGTGQTVFTEPVRAYLELISYDSDWWASRIELPAFQPTRVVIDMKRGFGRPILDKQRIPLDGILSRFAANERIDDIARDLELDRAEVENVIRAAWRPAAA